MPQTPGKRRILAKEAADAVQSMIDNFNISNTTDASSTHKVEVLTQKGKAEVKSALADCTLVHFAYHGETSSTDPSQSKLFLGPADLDGHIDTKSLTMAELIDIDMSPGRAKLAFLSACSTAENSSGQLLNEVIHIASGFRLIGFSHVVGTLWPANNVAALQTTKLFYDGLLKAQSEAAGEDDMINNDIAHALHSAISVTRRNGVPGGMELLFPPRDLLLWAPFVHFRI